LSSLKLVFAIAVVESLWENLRWRQSWVENIVVRFVFDIAVVELFVILTARRSSGEKFPRVSGTAGAHGEAFGGAEEMTLSQYWSQ